MGTVNLTGGVAWRTALDVDFSAQGSQSLSTNTTYSIAGQTYTKINSANEATAMALTNGTGVVVTPTAGANDYNGATRTFPGLEVNLASIIPTFHLGMGIRAWILISVDTPVSNFDNSILAIDRGAAKAFVVKRGYGTGGIGFERFINLNSTNQGFHNGVLVAMADSNRTMVLEANPIFGERITSYHGTNTAWPALTALTRHTMQSYFSTTGQPDSNDPSVYRVVFGAQRSSVAYTATIKALRIDYLANPE
jgi:hypothetical protein